MKATKGKQLAVQTENVPGAGAALFGVLKTAKINLNACCCYEMGKEAHFMLAPEDIAAARNALRKAKFKALTEPIVLVEVSNKAGALADVLEVVRDLGANTKYAYASASTKKSALVVLSTDADAKVVKALNK